MIIFWKHTMISLKHFMHNLHSMFWTLTAMFQREFHLLQKFVFTCYFSKSTAIYNDNFVIPLCILLSIYFLFCVTILVKQYLDKIVTTYNAAYIPFNGTSVFISLNLFPSCKQTDKTI